MHMKIGSALVAMIAGVYLVGYASLNAGVFAQQEPTDSTPVVTATTSAETPSPAAGAPAESAFCTQKDHLDTGRLAEAARTIALPALASAKFTRMNETNVEVEIGGHKAIITGAGEVVIFRFSSDVPEAIQFAVHKVASEVNNVC